MDDRLRKLFDDEGCAEFLLVHESGGFEWFNKERFEDLILWLYLASVASMTEKTIEKKRLPEELVRLHATVMELFTRAETAGYRLDSFLVST